MILYEQEGELDMLYYGDAVDVMVDGESVEIEELLARFVGKRVRLRVVVEELP